MHYRPKHFDLPPGDTWPGQPEDGIPPYVLPEEAAVAVDVALTVRRPVLVSGPPGSGKTMLARAMAGVLRTAAGEEWRYLRHTFTSRSRLEGLTAEVDHLRRLHDAQAAREGEALPERWAYVEPGILWWTFDPESAARRGASEEAMERLRETLGREPPRPRPPRGAERAGDAVLLLDEIDKAEPDLPNDLLQPLDEMAFPSPETGHVAAPADMRLLVVITTNGERELPPAFLRRCVSLRLRDPGEDGLVGIARQHFAEIEEAFARAVARKVVDLREEAPALGLRAPSTSEFLDAVRACRERGIDPDHPLWARIEGATLLKRTDWEDDGAA